MSVPTKTIRGLSGMIAAAKAICLLNATFRPTYVHIFTGPELVALDALTAACEAFLNQVPLGG